MIEKTANELLMASQGRFRRLLDSERIPDFDPDTQDIPWTIEARQLRARIERADLKERTRRENTSDRARGLRAVFGVHWEEGATYGEPCYPAEDWTGWLCFRMLHGGEQALRDLLHARCRAHLQCDFDHEDPRAAYTAIRRLPGSVLADAVDDLDRSTGAVDRTTPAGKRRDGLDRIWSRMQDAVRSYTTSIVVAFDRLRAAFPDMPRFLDRISTLADRLAQAGPPKLIDLRSPEAKPERSGPASTRGPSGPGM